MWFIRCMQVLFSAIGLFFIGVAIRNLLRGTASRRWPQVQGRILRSFVLVQTDEGESFTAQVEFEYVVEGSTHRGTRLRYGRIGRASRRRAEQVLAPYPVGAYTPVFYDPRKPSDAVLIQGTSWGNAAIALFGAVFLVCGLAVQL